MTSSKEQLLQNLLTLASEKNSAPPAKFQSEDKSDNDTPIAVSTWDFSRMTESASESVSQILQLFEQLDISNNQLAQELLAYYEQFNCAFEASAKVARCKTIDQALPVLVEEIAHAVDAQFYYYLGHFVSDFKLPEENLDLAKNVIYSFNPQQNPDEARRFFENHEMDLQTIPHGNLNHQVLLIGYTGPHHIDMEGKGNVLAVRLMANDPSVSLGTLIFIRSSQKDLFAAVEMKLTASLAKMGTTILDNIYYNEKLQVASLQTVTSLVRAMEAKDAYTSGHSNRVAEMACKIGKAINLDEQQIQLLEWAGLLHDIGKIGIREEVLSKPGKLTEEEFNHIKSHPVKSCNVLEPIDALRDIRPAVRHHHEHFDGSGYPDGLQGAQIPLLARILQIADIWDALTSTRSYRAAMTKEKALEIIRREAGITMDPELVKTFLVLIGAENTDGDNPAPRRD
jgi:HD superfamily phosphodiesterase